jgi:hypothetical protein
VSNAVLVYLLHSSLTPSSPSFILITDPSGLDDLIQHVDAVRVTLMECDKEGCVMAEGVKNGDMWQVNGGLQPGTDSTVKVISFAMDDTE